MKKIALLSCLLLSLVCWGQEPFGGESEGNLPPPPPPEGEERLEAVPRRPEEGMSREHQHHPDRSRRVVPPGERGKGAGEDAWRQQPPIFSPHPDAGQLLEKLKSEKPAEYERLVQLRQQNPRAFSQEIRKLAREAAAEFKQQLFQNDEECRRLADRIRECQDEGQKAELQQQLRAKLAEGHKLVVADCSRRLQQLQQQLDDLQKNSEQILERRMKAMLRGDRPGRGRGERPDQEPPRPPRPPQGEEE